MQPLQLDVDGLNLRIVAALEAVDKKMLEIAWDELDCRLDICHFTIICRSNDNSYIFIAIIPFYNESVSIIYGQPAYISFLSDTPETLSRMHICNILLTVFKKGIYFSVLTVLREALLPLYILTYFYILVADLWVTLSPNVFSLVGSFIADSVVMERLTYILPMIPATIYLFIITYSNK
jgi:hypothetical protein